eukprot:c8496_g1_i1 orf=152-1168(+)
MRVLQQHHKLKCATMKETSFKGPPSLPTMKADDAGSSASHGSNASRTPSIFINPFDVEKDQLIRQLFELPVRVAAVVQSHRNHMSNGSGDEIGSPFSILTTRSTARETAEIRESALIKKNEDVDSTRSMFQERSECALKTRQEDTRGPTTYGRRKRRRIDQPGAAPPSLEYTSTTSADGTLGNARTSQDKLVSVNDEVLSSTSESKEDENLVENCMVLTQKQGSSASSQTARDRWPVAGQDKVVPVVPVSTINVRPRDSARFIITAIRTLRHTRHGDMQKLFEVLSVSDLPVEKCSFLEELVQQAHHYKKEAVAKELAKYRSEVCQVPLTSMGDCEEG